MNNKLNAISDELLNSVSGGTFGQGQKDFLDKILPEYRKAFPNISLDELVDKVFLYQNRLKGENIYSEEEIAEIKSYIAHYWN